MLKHSLNVGAQRDAYELKLKIIELESKANMQK